MREKTYKHDRVELRQWDPKTRTIFSIEKQRLVNKLGKYFEIHHIGSTAVHGLGGKNIVDIILLVPNKEASLSVIKTLESIGYDKSKEFPGTEYRIFFNCNRDFKGKPVHIHLNLMWKTSDKYKDYLMFRDYLRKHPDEAKRYYLLKKQWARETKNLRKKYTPLKAEYIKEVLKKAKLENK